MILTVKIALLVIVLLLMAAVSFVGWVIRLLGKSRQKSEGGRFPACRIGLDPEPAPQWKKPREVQSQTADLRALGFEKVGAFSIPELGGLMIQGLIHPSEGLLSVVYDQHGKLDPHFNICADFADGSTVCAANTTTGNTLDKQPNHPILWLGKVTAQEMFETVQRYTASAPRKPIGMEEFAPHFKNAYARSVNWRLKKGGASRDEIRRQAEKKGHHFNDEQVEQCFQNLRKTYLERLQEGCIAQYLDERQPAPNQWQTMRDRTFAIAETLEINEVIDAIGSNVPLDVEQRHQLEKVQKNFGENGVSVIENILNKNVGSLGLKKLGEVTEPVRAVILWGGSGEPPEPLKAA